MNYRHFLNFFPSYAFFNFCHYMTSSWTLQFSCSFCTRCCLVIKSNGFFSVSWHHLTPKTALFKISNFIFCLLAVLRVTPKFGPGSVFNSLLHIFPSWSFSLYSRTSATTSTFTPKSMFPAPRLIYHLKTYISNCYRIPNPSTSRIELTSSLISLPNRFCLSVT